MNFTRCKIWKNDVKLLWSALTNKNKGQHQTKIKRVSNNDTCLPWLARFRKERLPMPIPESKYVYYGEIAHNKKVVLLNYTQLPIDR